MCRICLAELATEYVIDAVREERRRQDDLVESGKFEWNCSDPIPSDGDKLAVLTEEVGEVARCICEKTRDPEWRVKMKVELIQVAAVAIAWAEAL